MNEQVNYLPVKPDPAPRMTKFAVVVTPAMNDAIKAKCKREGLKMQDTLRGLINEWLLHG
jgi:hypothetical protein